MLEDGKASDEEISMMMTREYSKKVFGLDFALLVLADGEYESTRYYKNPLVIKGVKCRLCSQWFEVPTNNDRPFLLAWLAEKNAP